MIFQTQGEKLGQGPTLQVEDQMVPNGWITQFYFLFLFFFIKFWIKIQPKRWRRMVVMRDKRRN